MSASKPPAKPAKKEKKLYTTPVLEVYGNLSELTNTLGVTGNSDGGGGPINKTSL